MAYEGFAPPAGALPVGASACTPDSGPSGTHFFCTFTGLPAGAPASYTLSTGTGTSAPAKTDPTASDGTWSGVFLLLTTGQRTITLTAAGVTKFAQVNVSPATYTVQITQASNGSIVAKTTPGLNCLASVFLSDNSLSTATGLSGVMKTADANGLVQWAYTPDTKPLGQALAEVGCANGSLEVFDARLFNVP